MSLRKTGINIPAVQEQEMEALEPKDRPAMSDWAEANYVLSAETSDIPGRWSNDYTPFLAPIMDWWSDITTRQITIVKCTQAGGSELANIAVGYTCDIEPAPTLIVMPREEDAKRRLATRIRPMFKANPRLLRHLPRGRIENLNVGKETVFDNMILYIAWASSPAALADNPVAKVILDEVGKYPAAVGRETDPISLAKKRQRTFSTRRKLLVISSPVHSGDLLDAEYQKGDRCEWHVRCPFCSKFHIMSWANMHLDKDGQGELLDPELYRADHRRCNYICPLCRRYWTEYERWEAVMAGKFVPEGSKLDDSGEFVGRLTSHHSCRITALMLHPVFQTMGDLAGDWAAAQLGKKAGNFLPLQDFINSQLGEPWRESTKPTELSKLKLHVGTYPEHVVPRGVQLLTAGVDIQTDHVWVSVDGWGYLSEVWSIFEGRLETGDTAEILNLDLLRRFLTTAWQTEDNVDLVFYISRTAIDCGYRPDVIVDFCRKCTELSIVPVRGDDSVKTRPYRAVRIAGGLLTRYDLNVNEYKNRLYRLLFEAATPGAGFWHLHKGTDEQTLGHLTSEEQIPLRTRRGRTQMVWTLKHEHVPNHLWDAKVYSAFAAELVGARSLQPLKEKGLPTKDRTRQKRGSFLDDLPELFSP